MARAALWCALALVAGAAAYTIDCNHEYTDCDTELSKLTAEDDDVALPSQIATATVEKEPVPPPSTSTAAPTRSTPQSTTTVARTVPETTEEDAPTTESYNQKARARLLNLNVDELKNFAIDLHNQTELNNKKLSDISDVTLDDEVDDDKLSKIGDHVAHKGLPDRFYSNLQAPFHSMVPSDHFDEAANEAEMCKENDVTYKVGDRMDRGCEETCECMPTGQFICAPRCKHPYIRRGRHLSDPLCFESPVDECCSIIACATGNGDMKVAKLEVCKYGNDTYLVGNTWNVGCEQRCSCEKNSVVTCKPRCPPLPQSDKCINVQDPNDACCEVQVCDVSQDVHEEEADNVTNSTTVSAEKLNPMEESPPTTMRPLVLMEPIGSIKVLQNNSVQVTLIHTNSSEDPIHLLLSSDGGSTFKDVELKYDNLILNLDGGKDYILKTKETGTKFNFTITSTEVDKSEALEELVKVDKKIGCTQDEKFYEVGEEFHIGCSELCECTGDETRECVALECPSHVGLELMSKGCVKWAPSPPPTPPNCCPRAARCLSDGTCHYKGVPIPNWTDVPVSLSGCSTRCFCENGELDCQEVCSPLPPLPPQSLRCPPAHRPAPVNISDEDCCQQWGCVPNAGKGDIIHPVTTAMHSAQHHVVYPPRLSKPVDNDFYRRQNQAQTLNKLYKPFPKTPFNQYRPEIPNPDNHYIPGIPKDYSSENMTVFDFDHLHIPSQNDAVVILSNNSYSNTGRHQEEQSDPFDSPFPKPVVIAKQPVYKYIQSSLPEVILPPQTKPRNKDIKQSHSLKPNQNLPSHKSHQPTYFTPASKNNNRDVSLDFKQSKIYDKTSGSYIPFRNNSIQTPERFELPLPVKEFLPDSEIREHGRYMTAVKRPEKPKQMTDKNRWEQNTKLHVLTKLPNPYETVLLRAVQKAKAEPSYLYDYHNAKPYPGLDLENLLSQEVESGVSRNLERSADKKRLTAAGQPPSSDVPTTQQVPQVPFLPTVPPTDSGNIHFPHDVGEVDYDQNNIHRPVNPLVPGIPGFPPGLPVAPSSDENKKLTVITLVSDSPTSVKMLFGLPPVLVGLRGSVDLRYTDKADEEITHWYSQVFAPADEILTTSRLEFRLTGLKPSTVYKLRGKLYLHNLPVEPESEIYTIRTQDLPTIAPVEEKRREIDSRLTVLDVNDTVAHITWRRFTEEELQFIDAIQVRYRPVGNPLYSMTELLHHSRAAASLHELRPGSRYEASLVLVPPPRATTELTDPTVVEFTTAPYVDPYNWSVQLEARSVGSEAAELTWKGIPSPAERWVRVYRAAHACGNNHREHDAFRLATRDLPPAITLSGLEPDTRCRVWLELFLTNGKVKTSNVLEINTKSLDSPEPIDNAIEASSIGGRGTAPRGDYYGALVVVGVVAALGALTSLLLLLVVVRRHRPRSVPITPVPTAPRESSLPPYDNPAYKLELQQETMDL